MPGLDFLDGASAASADDVRFEPTDTGPARGADGKFTAAQADPAPDAPTAAPDAAPPAPVDPPAPGHVPISAMLDEREKRQALEKRLADLEAARPADGPAPELDPDTSNALLQMRLNTSEEFARDKEGDEAVDSAKAWAIERFKTNPSYQAEVLAKPNPYKAVVADHKAYLKLQATSDLDLSDLDAFKAWKAAGGSAAAPPTQTLIPPQSPPAPPRSLASAPAAGGHAVSAGPQGPGEAFKSIFQG